MAKRKKISMDEPPKPFGQAQGSEPNEEITRLIRLWTDGDREALGELLELLYDDLRHLAERYLRRAGQANTLQTTAVIHEVYLRLAGPNDRRFEDPRQFFAFIVKVIRSVLSDYAKAKLTQKRGEGTELLSLEDGLGLSGGTSMDLPSLLSLIEALERLGELDQRQASIVEMRFFGGLSNEEIADVLGISSMTVKRDWRLARRWLSSRLGE